MVDARGVGGGEIGEFLFNGGQIFNFARWKVLEMDGGCTKVLNTTKLFT